MIHETAPRPLRFLRVSSTLIALWALGTTIKVVTSDGLGRWQSLHKLLESGVLDHEKFSLIGPLFATPWVWVDALFPGRLNLAMNHNLFVFLFGLWALRRLMVPVMGRPKTWIFSILLLCGSMFSFHVLNFFGEVFSAVCLALGCAYLSLDRPRLAWPILALGVANTPAHLPAAALVAGHQFWVTRRWRDSAGLVLPVILILVENTLRRGSPFGVGYDGESFSTPFYVGALSLLFSFGKGLLFYAPGLFITVACLVKPMETPLSQRLMRTWMIASLGLLLVYARWWDWSGDEYWGPRFFLFCCFPASLAIADVGTRLRSQWGLILLTLLIGFTFWIGYDGLVFGEHARLAACIPSIEDCWYQFEDASWVRPFTYPRLLKPREILIAGAWTYCYLALVLTLVAHRFSIRKVAQSL